MSNVLAFNPDRPRRRKPTAATPAPHLVGSPLKMLWDSWIIALVGADKSPHTLKNYSDTMKIYLRWLEENGHPLDSEGVTAEHNRLFLAAEIERTSKASAKARRGHIGLFWAWVIREKERTNPSPMENVDTITVPEKVRKKFSDADLVAILATCSGDDFLSRRDTAMIRIFMDTGVRVSGMAGIRYDPNDEAENDVHLAQKRVTVRLKGGRELEIPLGKKAALALDRYLRIRHKHPRAAESPMLWLGQRGTKTGGITAGGIYHMVHDRGLAAGIQDAHPHRFRTTFSDRYLRGGGDLDGLMAIAGWTSYDMPRRYAGEWAAERAREKHVKLSPGDRI